MLRFIARRARARPPRKEAAEEGVRKALLLPMCAIVGTFMLGVSLLFAPGTQQWARGSATRRLRAR
eukprot:gene833-22973_t